ncbi:MAG: hypothetical protein KDA32_04285 [Phycisphaerales bacterium]|nr:hypothetical protein [Phycisphaerales bacterium]
MSKTIRVIVVNTDEGVAADLRAALLSIGGVKIVAEVDEPALLAQALHQFPAEALLVHLDPTPTAMMDVVAPLVEANKDRITAFAMTEDRDAELVMRAMRAGMKELLWKPFPPEQLAEILNRISADKGAGGRRIGRLITVVGAAGGTGATTLSTNLAVELALVEEWYGGVSMQRKPRVAIVDMDFRFGQVAMQLDAQPTYTIAELCDTVEAIDPAMIERAMCKHETGAQILARPNDFAEGESISAGQCASVIATLQEHYDFVVADFPARFDATANAVFDMADIYLLNMQLLVPAVRNTDRMLHELGRAGYALDRVRLVCNRLGRDTGYLEKGDVESTLKRKIDFVLPDDWKTSSTAVNMGQPLATHAPKSRLRLAFRDIAIALAGAAEDESGPTAAPEPRDEERKGLFALFGSKK